MRNKGFMFLALILALLGTFLFLQYQKKQKVILHKKLQEKQKKIEKQILEKERPVLVVVAKRNLPKGEKIAKVDVELKPIPKKEFQEDFFKNPEDVIGKYAKSIIFKGEPIRKYRLVDKGGARKLTELLSPGKRAITVKVDNISSMSGFLKQGDKVDVVALFEKKDLGKEYSKIVLQNLKVLAVGREVYFGPEEDILNAGGAKPKNPNKKGKDLVRSDKGKFVQEITLEVTPSEAEKLMYVMKKASLVLIGRSPVDKQVTDTKGVTLKDVAGFPSIEELRNMQQRGHKIVFILGDRLETKYIK